MLVIVCWIAVDDPWPISIMVMTAAIPITMPSVVRNDRRMFRRSDRQRHLERADVEDEEARKANRGDGPIGDRRDHRPPRRAPAAETAREVDGVRTDGSPSSRRRTAVDDQAVA